ncbi:putative carbamoyl transferase, NodU family [Desulfocapsa sulfexigens DSM 10523]|uniref:Putative carbamoyl transferase, NodU family n=2 Tax=Desulfocapsa TaxID=53318 RepID=M1PHC9_DESSD|nr:carbamoyltransferase [Desulfocapsa sulfexigens]AGF79005.1 putative carbamoyl transferase, NodU family [Desulfocapsa sulfexigens DSM 10523]
MNILGISAYYHDSAAVLIRDGQIIAAAQEERFTRIKHDHDFPHNAIRYCLAEAGIEGEQLDAVTFYDKPILKFVRIMETYFSVAPRGLASFMKAMPLWTRQKLWIPYYIEKGLAGCGVSTKNIYFTQHHESHAASSFYPSPFDEAAVLTMDGVGEWATATIAVGRGNKIEMVKELCFPHSLGLLYSAITYFCGFRVNSGEYKLMGLAPYGSPKYVDRILENLLDLKEDGSFRLDMKYFGYMDGLRMTGPLMDVLLDGSPREPESPITTREMDIAASIQVVTEMIVLKMARYTREITGMKNLCLSGGVALNCVANGRLLREGIFDDIYIQPASGDAGGALGAALLTWYQINDQPRSSNNKDDSMQGSYLGPSFEDDEIEAYLRANNYVARKVEGKDWAREIAGYIANEKVVGLFQGRMEFGPRALGCRSIIGDARSTNMQSTMNLKIKYRESFRPFAPSCLEEKVGEYFDIDRPSPYMLIVADVRKERCLEVEGDNTVVFEEQINQLRSDIPAITHVDYSARIQTVSPKTNKPYYDIIKAFDELTGYGVIINTSFNVRGEPIVCTPEDAYRCFMRTEMDCLVLGSFLLEKSEQPEFVDNANWRNEYQLD